MAPEQPCGRIDPEFPDAPELIGRDETDIEVREAIELAVYAVPFNASHEREVSGVRFDHVQGPYTPSPSDLFQNDSLHLQRLIEMTEEADAPHGIDIKAGWEFPIYRTELRHGDLIKRDKEETVYAFVGVHCEDEKLAAFIPVAETEEESEDGFQLPESVDTERVRFSYRSDVARNFVPWSPNKIQRIGTIGDV